MCGIVGGYAPVERGIQALQHRGPDATGSITVGKLFFGHTRLAILDLDPRSNQPFTYGIITLVFNGEIWNYQALRDHLIQCGDRFTTTGDTEVLAALLNRYHLAALPMVEGMFACAWTQDGQTLYLARDRFGEVPLHIAKQRPFFFASEKKALLKLGVHFQSLDDIQPGHYAIITERTIQQIPYYEIPLQPMITTRIEAAQTLKGILQQAVQERQISDVPVCTLLSGGIDSSIIAYELQQVFPNLVAYTAVYNPASNDLKKARLLAQDLHLELREVYVPLPEIADIQVVIQHIEMDYKAQVEIGWPCLKLAQQIRDDGFKVVFSGEGSDELWASYGFAYHALQEQDWYTYRKHLFLSQARKNFMRCNKIFMAHSIECRLPFLNTTLVEYALSLPQDIVQDGKTRPKAVLQDAYRLYIPEAIWRRPKVAFQDGLGLKSGIAKTFTNPKELYHAEYRRFYS